MRSRNLFLAIGGKLLVAGVVLSQAATSASPQKDATATISVSANLVVVPVTVRDNKDHFIRSLTKDDFTLTADGKPQTIRYFDREDDQPLTVGLLVDVSGSQRSVLDNERTASAAFLDNLLQPDRDKAFVVQFGHTADLLADITGSTPKLQAALQKIDGDDNRPSFSNGGGGNGGGSNDPNDTNGNGGNNNGGYGRGGRRGGGGSNGNGTVLYDAVFLSSDEVLNKASTAKDGTPARKAIVLLTDGEDRGSKESITSAIEAAQRSNVALYAIYYKGEEQRGNGGGGFPGGGRHGGMGGGFPGGFPGGGGRGGGYPGGGGGNGGGGGRSNVDGKKILERMAGETGGRVFEVSKKETLPDIYKQIAEELRSQYRLGFTPANNDEGFHKLVVDIPKEKKLIVQHREGYYTGAAK